MPHPMSVVIVGGGISGLATAFRILERSADISVTVLEASNRPGGAIASGELRTTTSDTARIDIGAEALLNLRPEAVTLVRNLGLGDRLVYPGPVGAAVYSRGELHDLPADTMMGVPSNADTLRGLLTDAEVARAADESTRPFAPPRTDLSVTDFVADRFGTAVVDRLVEPLLGGVYAGHARSLSLQATMPRLWQIVTHDQAEANNVSEAIAKARQHSAGTTPPPVFASTAGGLWTLIETLTAKINSLGGLMRTSHRVTNLVRNAVDWTIDTTMGSVRADHVIFATPAHVLGSVLFPLIPDVSAEARAIPSSSMAITSMTLPAGSLHDLNYSGFLVPPSEGRFVKAATFSTHKWPWLADKYPNVEFMRASVGRDGEHHALSRDDDTFIADVLSDLSSILDRELQPIDIRVDRWNNALPQYRPGHTNRVQRIRDYVQQLPNVHLVGASWDGLGIAACTALACDVADAVLGDVV